MREKMLFLGSVLLVSNIAFASSAYVLEDVQQISIIQNQQSATFYALATLLSARGLNEDVVQDRVNTFVSKSKTNIDMMVNNTLHMVDGLSQKALYDYMATKALMSLEVDLSDYETLVSLVHEIKMRPLSSSEIQNVISLQQMNAQLA